MEFLVYGIHSKLKFPVAYYLFHFSINKTILRKIIIDNVNKLFDIGLCPKFLVCDWDTANQNALKLLNVIENSCFFP